MTTPGDDFEITPHLWASEIKCRCCRYGMRPDEFSRELAELFERFRHELGDHPLEIGSGCRCPEHNASKEVQGHPQSQHLRGRALDLHRTTGMTPEWMFTVAETIPGIERGGIGIYNWGIHIDLGRCSRWDNRTH